MYKHEGERFQAAKNANLDWNNLAEIRPKNINFSEALSYAARAFMVGYLIKE